MEYGILMLCYVVGRLGVGLVVLLIRDRHPCMEYGILMLRYVVEGVGYWVLSSS